MVFESKVDWWYYVTIVVALLIVVGAGFAVRRTAGGLGAAVMLLPGLFAIGIPIWLLFSTHYTVTAEKLAIKAAWINIDIPRSEIRSITPSHGVARSSPALSLDRLEIRYGMSEVVLVSPKDQKGFMAALGMPLE